MADAPEMLTELDISEAMGEVFKNALPNWKPVSVAYVDADGKPQISYRGTVQRLNSKQLAMWARNPEGGMVKALDSKPTLAFLYADFMNPDGRIYLNIVGHGHIDSDEGVRKTVYENSPELERNQDADRKGVAIVVDIDEVNGIMGGKFLRMRP